ncbi:MAG TPA: hypothetical protein VKX39_01115 [Bryobacteraceae bacterium]|jgi:hypothetical protein|nr:hypothetical protein [Bryobacteraceae bacterium]
MNVWRALIAAIVLSAAAWPQPAALPRTPHGDPNLEGIWTSASVVPLERPAELNGQEFYTPAEAAENAKRVLGISSWERLGAQAREHYNMSQYGLDLSQVKVASTLRTSLIVGPEGRVPPFTAEARQRLAERAARNRGHQFDGPENRPLQEQCLMYSTEGPPMLPSAYNSNLQIVQDARHVAIVQEMIHSTRVIPTDNSPHLAPEIRQWAGDSRGRWEGDTLVVDTTNFTDRTAFRGSTEHLHLIERFTRVDADTILYEFTAEDPHTWTRPWTAQITLARIEGPIFEFACHEGNLGIANTLSGARAAEKAAAEAARKESK